MAGKNIQNTAVTVGVKVVHIYCHYIGQIQEFLRWSCVILALIHVCNISGTSLKIRLSQSDTIWSQIWHSSYTCVPLATSTRITQCQTSHTLTLDVSWPLMDKLDPIFAEFNKFVTFRNQIINTFWQSIYNQSEDLTKNHITCISFLSFCLLLLFLYQSMSSVVEVICDTLIIRSFDSFLFII